MGKLHTLSLEFIEFDAKLHERLSKQFPIIIPRIDRVLEETVRFLSNSLFALIVVFISLILGIAGVRTLTLVSGMAAWAIAFLWIAKSPKLQKLTILSRMAALLILGATLGGSIWGLGTWALNSHAREQSGTDSPLKADLKYQFYGRSALYFNYINDSQFTAQQPKVWSLLLDLTRPYHYPGQSSPNALPTQAKVFSEDFVKPGEKEGSMEILNTPGSRDHVKPGDKLHGIAWITCANCTRTRAYYIYFEVGVGGWYSESDDLLKLKAPKPTEGTPSDEQIQEYLDKTVPPKERIPIPENPDS